MNDVTFSGQGIVIITALLVALSGAIGILFRQLIASKDAALKDMTGQRDSYQKMAYQSIVVLEQAANGARAAKGLPPFQVIAPVVPEHNSPTTPAQEEEAARQTLLARATAAALEFDIVMVPVNLEAHQTIPELENKLMIAAANAEPPLPLDKTVVKEPNA